MNKKLLIALMLYAATFTSYSLSSENPFILEEEEPSIEEVLNTEREGGILPSFVYDTGYKAYKAGSQAWKYGKKQLSRAGNYALSQLPQSWQEKITSWTTNRQVQVFAALAAVLALVGYNKDYLISIVQNAYNNAPDVAQTMQPVTHALKAGSKVAYSYLPASAQETLTPAITFATENPKVTAAAAGTGLLALHQGAGVLAANRCFSKVKKLRTSGYFYDANITTTALNRLRKMGYENSFSIIDTILNDPKHPLFYDSTFQRTINHEYNQMILKAK